MANSAAALKQQAIVQHGLYGHLGPMNVGIPPGGGPGVYAPSPYANDSLYKLSLILNRVIVLTEYEPMANAWDVTERVYGTMGTLGLPPSNDDRAALLRLAWKCRAILPPELATYAALGGGVEGENRGND